MIKDIDLFEQRNKEQRNQIGMHIEKLEKNLTSTKLEYIDYLKKKEFYDIEYRDNIADTVLLIGGSGYFGIHLLKALVERQTPCIYILSRHCDVKEIKKEIETLYDNFVLEQMTTKLVCIQGDISCKNFGLSSEQYQKLLNQVDVVINLAANMSESGKYFDFYSTNVAGVRNIIYFMKHSGKEGELFQASTIGVSEGEEFGKEYSFMGEYTWNVERNYDYVGLHHNYYMTKNLAEKEVNLAREEGLKVNIFRFGNIGFCSKTGKFSVAGQTTSIIRLIKSFVKMGIMPGDQEKVIDLTYVDDLADAVARIVANRSNLASNKIYHLTNEQYYSFQDLASIFNVKTCNSSEIWSILKDKIRDKDYKNDINNILQYYLQANGLETTKTLIASDCTVKRLRSIHFLWKRITNDSFALFAQRLLKEM